MEIEDDQNCQRDSIRCIQKNMVQRRTQLFETGVIVDDVNEDINKKPPVSSEQTKPRINTPKPNTELSKLKTPHVNTNISRQIETPPQVKNEPSKPKITTPKPKINSQIILQKPGEESYDRDIEVVEPCKKSVAFELNSHDTSESIPNSEADSVSSSDLTESQIVRPKTPLSQQNKIPTYAQVDKSKKINKAAKPPKPNIPKIDRMRGRPTSDTHKYDGFVVLQKDHNVPKAAPDAGPVSPPVKPPRTFAHDEYLKLKAEKSVKKNKRTDDVEVEDSNLKLKDGTDNCLQSEIDRKLQEERLYEEIGPAKVDNINRNKVNPIAKPKRPSRPPSQTESKAPAPNSNGTHEYEEINGFSEKKSPSNVLKCDNFDNIDSNNVTMRNKQKKVQIADQSKTVVNRPKTKPPPPPRPKVPSGEEDKESRWDKGFVRVVKHNDRLRDDDFIADKHIHNPSYGKKKKVPTATLR